MKHHIVNGKISGVEIKELSTICDERGYLYEVLRASDNYHFGQAYITAIHDGAIKAWHYHKLQYDCVCCISGMIKMVLWDGTNLMEIFMGDNNRLLVKIPPNVYHGWKAYNGNAIVLNLPTKEYNNLSPDEYRKPYNTPDIPYNWDRVNK